MSTLGNEEKGRLGLKAGKRGPQGWRGKGKRRKHGT